MTTSKVICSLCQHEIPATYLRQHQAAETREIVAYTIELIKQGHPEWSDADPTCQKCWDEYRAQTAA
jgi:hypothetical protein